jgi:hypothetical protein
MSGIAEPLAWYRIREGNLMGAGEDIDKGLRLALAALGEIEMPRAGNLGGLRSRSGAAPRPAPPACRLCVAAAWRVAALAGAEPGGPRLLRAPARLAMDDRGGAAAKMVLTSGAIRSRQSGGGLSRVE